MIIPYESQIIKRISSFIRDKKRLNHEDQDIIVSIISEYILDENAVKNIFFPIVSKSLNLLDSPLFNKSYPHGRSRFHRRDGSTGNNSI
jgi:hypothetical protein